MKVGGGAPTSCRRTVSILLANSRSLSLAVLTSLLMKLTRSSRITWWRDAEECVTTRCQPVIEDWAKFRERPNSHNPRQPFPARQSLYYFDPCEIAFRPSTAGRKNVHLFSHLFTRVGRSALQDFRIVVIKPFDSMIAIERLNSGAYPAAEIAIAVCVNFDSWLRSHQVTKIHYIICEFIA